MILSASRCATRSRALRARCSANVQVAAMDTATVTLDANHPLAGKDLTFELELVQIE